MSRWDFTPAQWWVVSEVAGIANYPAPIGRLCAANPDQARRELDRAGVLLGPYLQNDLHDALTTLAHPQRWIDGFGMAGNGEPIGLLAGSGHALSAIAVQDEDGTRLRSGRADQLVTGLLSALPGAGPGRLGTGTLAAPRGESAQDGILMAQTATLTRSERAERIAMDVLGADRDAEGQLAVNVRGPDGTRRSELLGWCDNTGDGRYLVTRHGDEVRTEPAGPDVFRARIDALFGGLGT